MNEPRYHPFRRGLADEQTTPPGQCLAVSAAFEYRVACSLPAGHHGDHQFDGQEWATRPWELR